MFYAEQAWCLKLCGQHNELSLDVYDQGSLVVKIAKLQALELNGVQSIFSG